MARPRFRTNQLPTATDVPRLIPTSAAGAPHAEQPPELPHFLHNRQPHQGARDNHAGHYDRRPRAIAVELTSHDR